MSLTTEEPVLAHDVAVRLGNEMPLHAMGESVAASALAAQRGIARQQCHGPVYILDELELALPVRVRIDPFGTWRRSSGSMCSQSMTSFASVAMLQVFALWSSSERICRCGRSSAGRCCFHSERLASCSTSTFAHRSDCLPPTPSNSPQGSPRKAERRGWSSG